MECVCGTRNVYVCTWRVCVCVHMEYVCVHMECVCVHMECACGTWNVYVCTWNICMCAHGMCMCAHGVCACGSAVRGHSHTCDCTVCVHARCSPCPHLPPVWGCPCVLTPSSVCASGVSVCGVGVHACCCVHAQRWVDMYVHTLNAWGPVCAQHVCV